MAAVWCSAVLPEEVSVGVDHFELFFARPYGFSHNSRLRPPLSNCVLVSSFSQSQSRCCLCCRKAWAITCPSLTFNSVADVIAVLMGLLDASIVAQISPQGGHMLTIDATSRSHIYN